MQPFLILMADIFVRFLIGTLHNTMGHIFKNNLEKIQTHFRELFNSVYQWEFMSFNEEGNKM